MCAPLSSRWPLLLLAVAIGWTAASIPALRAQSAGGSKARNPTSKVYVAEREGVVDIDTGLRIENATPKKAYTAGDAILHTKADSTTSLVFSNGTGAFLEPDSSLRVLQFVQEPFLPNRTDLDVEPSMSRMVLALARGGIALCTSRLVAGSSLEVTTPHSIVQIRGKRLVIRSDETSTIISLMEGDLTVRGGPLDPVGRTLKPGEQAVIRPGLAAGPFEVRVQPIPPAELPQLEDRVTFACMARRTVYFDVGDRDADPSLGTRAGASVFDQGEEDVLDPIPVVPNPPDPPIFVSPSEIPQPAGSGR